MRCPLFLLAAAFAFTQAFADLRIVEPSVGATVPLLTESQKSYLRLPLAERRVKFADVSFRADLGLPAEEVDGVKREVWWPKTVRLAWEGVAADAVVVYKVVSKKNGAVSFEGKGYGGNVNIDNLEIACDYEWTVTCGTETAKFDIKSGDAARIEKGRKPGSLRLDAADREYLADFFRIKSDIDLRSDAECFGMIGSPLGDGVKWFHYSSGAYAGMHFPEGREAFATVFRVFLDEKNYPIYSHCIAGQDRTGAVAFILNALLGVDENELYLDWEITGLCNRGISFVHEGNFDNLIRTFKEKYPSDTINGSVEAYVLSLGFTADDIAKFRSTMLEK